MTVGVLVMAYGTPRDRDDIEAYYTDIRRGRTPPPDLLADLVRRYDAIGGTFPLRAITDAQIATLASELGPSYAVALGTKHSVPRIEDGVETLVAQGISRIVGLVLAPHYSAFSVGEYAARVVAASPVPVDVIEAWHLLPAYVDFLDRAVGAALSTLPAGAEVVFTAHSLPERILAAGDPYPSQLRETAAAVAARHSGVPWSIGWQSAGRTPEPWLGPDVLEVLRERSRDGSPGVVVCACGFVADHLEVAYDLDIEAASLAAELELPFARTASVNDDLSVMSALAALVAAR